MEGGTSTSTFLQRNTQPTVLQFLERLRASQTQFNLLGQGRGLATCLGRTAAKCGSFPRFCSSTRFLSAWKIWQDKTLVGHQGLLRPCRDWYSDNKHLFLQEPANITFVKFVTHKTFWILSNYHHTELSLAYLISKALGCVQKEPELVEWHGKTFQEEENTFQGQNFVPIVQGIFSKMKYFCKGWY